jgi:urease accessory protein
MTAHRPFGTRFLRTATLALGAAAVASPALAHHPIGGDTPASFADGVLSGIGHPMLGLDHFAFIVAMGVASAAMGLAFRAPLAFLAASMAGVMVAYLGATLPMLEPVVAGSALLIGAALVMGQRLPATGALGFFALAGLFHGNAYGGAIVGAEATPLLAYLLGLFATQYAIAVAAGLGITRLAGAADAAALPARLTGAAVAGIGFTFVFEMAEGALFGAL